MEAWGSAKNTSATYKPFCQKFTRTIIFYDRLAHTDLLFLNLNMLPIDKLLQDRIGLFMHKIFHGMHSMEIHSMYFQNCDIHNHNTRI